MSTGSNNPPTKVSKQLKLTTRHCLLNDFISENKSIKIVDQNASEPPYMELTITIEADQSVSSVFLFEKAGSTHRLVGGGNGIIATTDGEGTENSKKSLTMIEITSHAVLLTDGKGNCSWYNASGGNCILCASGGELSWEPVSDCENACG